MLHHSTDFWEYPALNSASTSLRKKKCFFTLMHLSRILLLFWYKSVCCVSVESVVDTSLTNDRNIFVWTLCSLSSATEKNPKFSIHCQYLTLKEVSNFGFLQCNSFERSGLQPKDRPAQRITFLLWQTLAVVIPDNKFREYQE